jgi:L-threonylcarbamoyladenylate synthase
MEIVDLSTTPLRDAVHKAAKELRAGSIVVYPTDTIYGLAVDALNVQAIERLKELKGREKKKPISVIVADSASIGKYAELTSAARGFAGEFLPGPLTLVLRAKKTIPEELTLNDTIGIRIPNNPFCLTLARELGRPYTSTSANRSGRETPASLKEVIAQFGNSAKDISLAIYYGDTETLSPGMPAGKPSTVLSCITDTPHILREGAITRAELGL